MLEGALEMMLTRALDIPMAPKAEGIGKLPSSAKLQKLSAALRRVGLRCGCDRDEVCEAVREALSSLGCHN